ncbi:MAG TPA: hypothetical protein VGC57_12155 [Cellulomonas sp.]
MPTSRRSSKRPYQAGHVPLDTDRATGGRRSEAAPDGEWTVQKVGGSERPYRCPGCDQLITPGTPHVVAWAADGLFGAESALADRRHWHSTCWSARLRRRPGRR